MKFLQILLLLLGGLFVTGRCVSVEVEDAAVELPVFKVMAGVFDYNYTFKRGQITAVKITNVPPNTVAQRAGLRKGDQLLAVDGIKAEGLSRPEFERLMQRKLEIGDSQRFTFLKSKGFIVRLNRTFDITYTVTGLLNPPPPES